MKKSKWLFGITPAGMLSAITYAFIFALVWHLQGVSPMKCFLIGALSLITFIAYFSALYAHDRLDGLDEKLNQSPYGNKT